ncbi:MAG: hypothetical protein JF597_51355 [Streptomyces sp.]|nr:hypothetical protein [Streptomyces sp.]
MTLTRAVYRHGEPREAVEPREDDVHRNGLSDDAVDAEVRAQRVLLAGLNGDCSASVGDLASCGPDGSLRLEAHVTALDCSEAGVGVRRRRSSPKHRFPRGHTAAHSRGHRGDERHRCGDVSQTASAQGAAVRSRWSRSRAAALVGV